MRKDILLRLIVILFMATMPLSNAIAQVPRLINYQASMLDQTNQPLTGNIPMTFSIYTDENSGSPVWSEQQTVNAQNGFINVYLGRTIPLNFTFDNEYWLEIKVQNGAPFTRTRIAAVPFSMNSLMAVKADTADIALTVVDGAITQNKLDPTVKAIPWGPAGGALKGTYPNPSLNADTVAKYIGGNFIRRDEAIIGGDMDGLYGLPVIRLFSIKPNRISPIDPATGNRALAGQTIIIDPVTNNPAWGFPYPNGAAGGDLSGTYPNPGVAKLRGNTITNVAPTNGQVLAFDGTNWTPTLASPVNLNTSNTANLATNGYVLTWDNTLNKMKWAVSVGGLQLPAEYYGTSGTFGGALKIVPSSGTAIIASSASFSNNASTPLIVSNTAGNAINIQNGTLYSSQTFTGNVIQVSNDGAGALFYGTSNGAADGINIGLGAAATGNAIVVNMANTSSSYTGVFVDHQGTGNAGFFQQTDAALSGTNAAALAAVSWSTGATPVITSMNSHGAALYGTNVSGDANATGLVIELGRTSLSSATFNTSGAALDISAYGFATLITWVGTGNSTITTMPAGIPGQLLYVANACGDISTLTLPGTGAALSNGECAAFIYTPGPNTGWKRVRY